MKKVVITGGHLTPALGLIDVINKEGGWQIYYFAPRFALEGDKTPSFEYQTIKNKKGVRLITFAPGRLQRHFSRHTLPALARVPISFLVALWHLWRLKPDLIVSFGSYVSTPVVVAGWLLRIPILTHEQTPILSLANKINGLFAQKIALAFFGVEAPSWLQAKMVFTGNPLREAIFEKKPKKETPLIAQLKKIKKPLLYVTGGKTGSVVINQAVVRLLPRLTQHFFVLHQVGPSNIGNFTPKKNYLPVSFVDHQEIGFVLAKAALVVSRSGANIVWELAALGKKAVLIPLPFAAGNEQQRNALLLAKIGLAVVLPQSRLGPDSLWQAILKARRLKPQKKEINWWRNQGKQAGLRLWQEAKKIAKWREN